MTTSKCVSLSRNTLRGCCLSQVAHWKTDEICVNHGQIHWYDVIDMKNHDYDVMILSKINTSKIRFSFESYEPLPALSSHGAIASNISCRIRHPTLFRLRVLSFDCHPHRWVREVFRRGNTHTLRKRKREASRKRRRDRERRDSREKTESSMMTHVASI